MKAFVEVESGDSCSSLVGVEHGLIAEMIQVGAGQGTLAPGTLLMRDGTKAILPADAYAVLGFLVDTTESAKSVTCYTHGSFLRSLVEAAMGAPVDQTGTDALRDKGIYLERSVPISYPPAS
jgi:hypothetical protein